MDSITSPCLWFIWWAQKLLLSTVCEMKHEADVCNLQIANGQKKKVLIWTFKIRTGVYDEWLLKLKRKFLATFIDLFGLFCAMMV